MKKKYLKPVIKCENILLEEVLCMSVGNESGPWDSKERGEQEESESDEGSEWGALW